MCSDMGVSAHDYTVQLQGILGLCLVLGVAILVLHAWISRTFPRNPKGSAATRRAAVASGSAVVVPRPSDPVAVVEGGAAAAERRHISLDLEEAVRGLNYCSLDNHHQQHPVGSANGAAQQQQQQAIGHAKEVAVGAAAARTNGAGPPSTSAPAANKQQTKTRQRAKPAAMSMAAAFAFLRQSPQIRCLAVMALAQVRRRGGRLFGGKAGRRYSSLCVIPPPRSPLPAPRAGHHHQPFGAGLEALPAPPGLHACRVLGVPGGHGHVDGHRNWWALRGWRRACLRAERHPKRTLERTRLTACASPHQHPACLPPRHAHVCESHAL